MLGPKRKPGRTRTADRRARPGKSRKQLGVALGLALAVVLLTTAWLVPNRWDSGRKESGSPASERSLSVKAARKAGSLTELLAMQPEGLGDVDIAEMNLLCATGLPGAEGLEIDKCLARLDEWARHVESETNRHLYRFRQAPENYRNSEGYFRMLMLVTVLQQDFGIHYNTGRMRNVDFTKSKDLFIHGMIDDDNGGTCVSMPAAYVAVGRRLGYPLKLVLAKAHVFCRWEGDGERFNIEATNQGMNSFTDAYYRSWPESMTPADIASRRYLRSLAPPEDLACFLALRGHCLLDTGPVREAKAAYAIAHRFAPSDPAYVAWARQAQARLRPSLAAGSVRSGTTRRVRRDPMEDIRWLRAIRAKNQRMAEPPFRRGAPLPPSVPAAPSANPRQTGPARQYDRSLPGQPRR